MFVLELVTLQRPRGTISNQTVTPPTLPTDLGRNFAALLELIKSCTQLDAELRPGAEEVVYKLSTLIIQLDDAIISNTKVVGHMYSAKIAVFRYLSCVAGQLLSDQTPRQSPTRAVKVGNEINQTITVCINVVSHIIQQYCQYVLRKGGAGFLFVFGCLSAGLISSSTFEQNKHD